MSKSFTPLLSFSCVARSPMRVGADVEPGQGRLRCKWVDTAESE